MSGLAVAQYSRMQSDHLRAQLPQAVPKLYRTANLREGGLYVLCEHVASYD